MDSPPFATADSFIGAVPTKDSFTRKVLKTVWVLLNLLVLVALPLAAWDMHAHDMHPHFIAWFVAGVFVLLAVPITFYEVAQHLEHYRAPRLQRHVIRILFMVPIYAVDWYVLPAFPKSPLPYVPTQDANTFFYRYQLARAAV